MTATQLIASIFARVQPNLPGNLRRVTRPQLNYVRSLILGEEIPAEVRHGLDGSLVWTPPGRDKYVITEDTIGEKHTIMKLSNLVESKSGSLFGDSAPAR